MNRQDAKNAKGDEGPGSRERLEALRIRRLTEELGLSEEQSAFFFPRLGELRELRREFRARRGALRQGLADELAQASVTSDTGISDKRQATSERLAALLDSLEAAETDFRETECRLSRESVQILTVEQQARYVVFQASFDRQARRVIEQLRRGGSRAPGRNR